MPGWSIDLVIEDIDKVFGKNKHEVSVPESDRPYIRLNYDKEINIFKKRKICDLVPDGYYVFFHPGTLKDEEPKADDLKFPEGQKTESHEKVEATNAPISEDGFPR